jgi:hypothetical protein
MNEQKLFKLFYKISKKKPESSSEIKHFNSILKSGLEES